ncbi:MAG: hypothetical protein LBU58_01555 [Clostridiales bacterium]|nr:hypothetical protein [Clostridiales bacterium]
MIKQHFYAESEKGLFRQDPGMDTIAKSKGVSDDFILSVLHEHCFYEPPGLQTGYVAGNKELYPVSSVCYWTASGELVLGRTVYARPRDPEGRAFFTHNFIVPAQNAAGLVPIFQNLPYVIDFKEECADPLTTNLPELAAFHFDTERCRVDDGDAALLKCGVNESVFRTLLFAVMEAIRTSKSLYIIPNVKAGQLHDVSRLLLKFLIAALPYPYRRRLGYATYVKRETALPGVNIYFLEREYKSYLSTGSLGGFVFDFVSNTFWKPDENRRAELASIYLTSAWEGRKRDRKPFYEFMNAASGPGIANPETLDALAAFWDIKGGGGVAEAVYRGHRQFVLTALAESVKRRNAALTPVLKEVFSKALDMEVRDRQGAAAGAPAASAAASAPASNSTSPASGGGSASGESSAYFPEPPLLASFVQYAENAKENETDSRVVGLCAETVAAARVADRVGYINDFFTLAMGAPRLFRKLQSQLTETYGSLLDGVVFHYVVTRLENCGTLQKLIDEIEFWWANNPAVLKDKDVGDAFSSKLRKAFAASKDKVGDGARFHSRMEFLLRNVGAKEDKRLIFDFVHSLLETVDRLVLDSLTGDSITYESLQALKIDTDALKNEEKYKTLEALKGFLCSEMRYVAEKSLKALRDQGQHAFSRSRDIILRILSGRIAQENYDRIVAIFSEPAPVPAGGAAGRGKRPPAGGAAAGAGAGAKGADAAAAAATVAFDDIFSYLNEHKNRGESCNFIKWAFRNDVFNGPNYTEWNNAVVTFFTGFTPKEFRVVFKNYAYLYTNAQLSDSEKNLKLIVDTFRARNAVIPKPSFTTDIRGVGMIALAALSIVIGVVLVFTLVSTLAK